MTRAERHAAAALAALETIAAAGTPGPRPVPAGDAVITARPRVGDGWRLRWEDMTARQRRQLRPRRRRKRRPGYTVS